MSKTKNPLYHISNDGKDVESVSGVFELLVKRLGLDPIIEFLESMFLFMSEQVKSYSMFIALKEFFDDIITKILMLLEKVRPLLSNT